MKYPDIVQISVSRSAELSQIVPAHRALASRRSNEVERFRKKLDDDLADAKARIRFEKIYSPNPIAVSDSMLAKLERMHLLLARAVVDIVDRWFSDQDARLWQRMPVESSEEEQLRWVARFGPTYAGNAGFARTDVLFGRSKNGADDEAPFFCEINGRMPFNGMLATWEQVDAMTPLGISESGITAMTSEKKDVGFIKNHFDPEKPVFCVRDESSPVSSETLGHHITQEVRLVRPEDLELRPSPTSTTGQAIWHRPSNTQVQQWFTEIRHQDWAALDSELARHLCLTKLNDFRTTMLVNDKRLIGIIYQEIPGMVQRGVLNKDEANILEQSIPETLLPGSKAMKDLFEASKTDPKAKDAWIHKLARSEGGKGIELGRNIEQEEWLRRLENLASKEALLPSDDSAVVQRLVDQKFFDIVRHEIHGDVERESTKLHLIASFFMIDLQKICHGPWCVGLESRLSLAPNNPNPGMLVSCVRMPDWQLCEQDEVNA